MLVGRGKILRASQKYIILLHKRLLFPSSLLLVKENAASFILYTRMATAAKKHLFLPLAVQETIDHPNRFIIGH